MLIIGKVEDSGDTYSKKKKEREDLEEAWSLSSVFYEQLCGRGGRHMFLMCEWSASFSRPGSQSSP